MTDKCEDAGWETRKKKSEIMVAPEGTDATKRKLLQRQEAGKQKRSLPVDLNANAEL